MNKVLLKQMILSNKSFLDISAKLNCGVDEFVDKLNDERFNTREMSLLVDFIPIHNPAEIFFENRVDETGTSEREEGGDKMEKEEFAMTNVKQKDAIREEQHLIAKRNASDEIVKILADNNLTITEAYDVLLMVQKKLRQQEVKSPS